MYARIATSSVNANRLQLTFIHVIKSSVFVFGPSYFKPQSPARCDIKSLELMRYASVKAPAPNKGTSNKPTISNRGPLEPRARLNPKTRNGHSLMFLVSRPIRMVILEPSAIASSLDSDSFSSLRTSCRTGKPIPKPSIIRMLLSIFIDGGTDDPSISIEQYAKPSIFRVACI